MITFILLSCFTIMASTVPVSTNVLPPPLSQGIASEAQTVVEAADQLQDAQTPAPLPPNADTPQPGVPQQPDPLGGPQFYLPSMQHYTWPSVGGGPMLIHLQPSIFGSQPANRPTHSQQPLIFPPYPYFPLVSSSYRNQQFSPYGYPMILESPLPQTPVNSPVLPAVTPSEAAPSEHAPQPEQQQQQLQVQEQQQQQQQNPQIVYVLQRPKSSPLGSLSSEELQMAAKMDQLGVYLTTLLTNLPAGAVQPASQGAGLVNPERQGIAPTVGNPSAGSPQTQRPVSSGPQPNTNGEPVGLEGPAREAATVQAPV